VGKFRDTKSAYRIVDIHSNGRNTQKSSCIGKDNINMDF
jgi:hypothetical protein